MKPGSSLYADGNGRYAYVRAGFSWPAFFLGPWWAIAKRRWGFLLPMSILEIGPSLGGELAIGHGFHTLGSSLVLTQLAYMLARGLYGNDWLAASLRRKGYARVVPGVAAQPA